MLLREFYEGIGGSYEDIKGRLCNDDIIKRFVFKFADEKSYAEMMEAVERNDVKDTILTSHKLKGVAANLGFIQLHEALSLLLVSLRQENQNNVDLNLVAQVTEKYRRIMEWIPKL